MPISMKAKDERKRAASSMGFGEGGHQMRTIEFAGHGIVLREFQQLFVAGMAFVVDADDALRPPAGPGIGEPAAGLLDPDHGGSGRGAQAIFDPVGDRFGAVEADVVWPSASVPDGPRRGSISVAKLGAAGEGRRGMSGKTAAPCRSRRSDRGEVPDEGGLPERGQNPGGLRDSVPQGRLDSGQLRVIRRPTILAFRESDVRQSS